MERLETIQIRSVSRDQVDEAIAAFNQLSKGESHHFINTDGLEKVEMYRNGVVEYDLILLLHWRYSSKKFFKSALGYLLAEIFSKFGQVNHSIWNLELGCSF